MWVICKYFICMDKLYWIFCMRFINLVVILWVIMFILLIFGGWGVFINGKIIVEYDREYIFFLGLVKNL